ncbi:MAG: DNA repair exonuclease, partial [Calditrichia bacterium]
MSIRLLHISDIHLGIRHSFLPEDKQEQRQEEIWQSFSSLIKEVSSSEIAVDGILITGDLFDSPFPPPALLSQIKTLFQRLEENRIPVIMVPGNHDSILFPDSVYMTREFPGVHLLKEPNIKEPLTLHIKEQQFDFYGMAFSGLSQPPFDIFQPGDSRAVNIALIHGSLCESREWRLHNQDLPLSRENLLASRFDYIALGHYHNFFLVEGPVTKIAYPGSLEPLSWRENAGRTLLFIEVNDQGKVQLNPREFSGQKKSFQTVSMDLSQLDVENNEALADYILNKYANANLLLRIYFKGISPVQVDTSFIREYCGPHFFYLEVYDETRLHDWDDIKRIAGESTIR